MTMQPAAVVFGDVELWATGYLRSALAARAEAYASGVWVDNKKPATNKPRIVAVRRDGGPSRGVFDFPRLTVRVWADKERDASDLARLVCALLAASPGNGPVVRAEVLSGPLAVPDDSQPQKLVTVQLTIRGESL